MELYERIQKVLNFRNMSQADVCRLTGLSSAKVSQVVSGKTSDPRISTIVPIMSKLSSDSSNPMTCGFVYENRENCMNRWHFG